jgi:hypothetical protein
MAKPKEVVKLCGSRRPGQPESRICRHPAGYKTSHPGSGRCYLHGGASPMVRSTPSGSELGSSSERWGTYRYRPSRGPSCSVRRVSAPLPPRSDAPREPPSSNAHGRQDHSDGSRRDVSCFVGRADRPENGPGWLDGGGARSGSATRRTAPVQAAAALLDDRAPPLTGGRSVATPATRAIRGTRAGGQRRMSWSFLPQRSRLDGARLAELEASDIRANRGEGRSGRGQPLRPVAQLLLASDP